MTDFLENFLEGSTMARKGQAGEVNKSHEIRQLIKANPGISANEAVDTLAQRGIQIDPGLFYFNKGKLLGKKGRRRKIRRKVESVMSNGERSTPPAKSDVIGTIKKVKGLAAEVGGLKKLAELVAALSE
jgi:hypothetical protein